MGIYTTHYNREQEQAEDVSVSCHMQSVQYYMYPSGGMWEDECRPTVHFTATSGQEVDFVSSYTWGGFHKGNEVTVQYAPARPQNALILFEALWNDVVMMVALSGLPFLVFGICWVYSLLRKRSRGAS